MCSRIIDWNCFSRNEKQVENEHNTQTSGSSTKCVNFMIIYNPLNIYYKCCDFNYKLFVFLLLKNP